MAWMRSATTGRRCRHRWSLSGQTVADDATGAVSTPTKTDDGVIGPSACDIVNDDGIRPIVVDARWPR